MHGQPQGVPTSGPMNRILSSRFAAGEGAEMGQVRVSPHDDGLRRADAEAELQPYSIYVPQSGRRRSAATG